MTTEQIKKLAAGADYSWKSRRRFDKAHGAASPEIKSKLIDALREHRTIRTNGFPILQSEIDDFAPEFWAMVDKAGECWPLIGKTLDKHQSVHFNGRSMRAHRVSYALVHGETPSLMVCHTCDRGGCVNPDHLFLGTHTDNMRDMTDKGRHGKRGLSMMTHYFLQFAPHRVNTRVINLIRTNPSLVEFTELHPEVAERITCKR